MNKYHWFMRETYNTDNRLIWWLCFVSFVCGIVATTIFFINFGIPHYLEKRGKDIGIMQYDGEKNKFVPKDTILLKSWEFYYLQHGELEK